MTKLVANYVSFSRKGSPILKPCSAQIRPGKLTALLGPNGAGKTSLLRIMLSLETPESGNVHLNDKLVSELSVTERAKALAYLPQIRPLAWPNRVYDVVALGRFAYGGGLGRLSPADKTAIDKAIADCDLSDLANRRADTLSGGELARMHCARAFAAQTPLLIADEPIAALDPRHQLRILKLIRNYVNAGGGALIVLHDMNHALKFADDILLMKDGEIIARGVAEDTLTPQNIKAAFDVKATFNYDQIIISEMTD